MSITVPSASRRKIDLFRTRDDSSHSDYQSSFLDYLDDYHLVKMRNNQDMLLRLSILQTVISQNLSFSTENNEKLSACLLSFCSIFSALHYD